MPRLLAAVLFFVELAPLTNSAGEQTARSALCSGANGRVSVIALQQDGRILLAGNFTNLGGQTQPHIGRLKADGCVDTAFTPSANNQGSQVEPPSPIINTMAVQPDGKILVGGDFDQLDGQPRGHLGRLNADGSLDGSFDPGATDLTEDPRFPDPQVVTSIAVQPDGRILVAGRFHTLAGQTRARIGRLSSDGSLDTSFNAGADESPTSGVVTMALQADGKILVAGELTTLGGQSRINLSRLNLDGSLDTSFKPDFPGPTLPIAFVRALAVQADGKILMGGEFGSQLTRFIVRLNADGRVDSAFNSDVNKGRGTVDAIALQADNKILVAEDSNADRFFGSMRVDLARLNPDGSPDLAFKAVLTYQGFSPGISSLAIQPDGEIIVGGNFDTVNGESHNSVCRMLPDGSTNPEGCPDSGFNGAPADQAFSIAVQPDGGTLVGAPFLTGGPPGRLNAEGSLDPNFNASALNIVDAISVQPDGKILVGGEFTFLDEQARTIIGRLNGDGTLDASFNANATFPNPPGQNLMLMTNKRPPLKSNASFPSRPGVYQGLMRYVRLTRYQHGPPSPFVSVNAMALQPDGKILVGGEFQAFGPRGKNIARLNADGSVDSAFNSQVNKDVFAIAMQPDGKVVVGGAFDLLNGEPREELGRLNPDGSLDPGFAPKIGAGVPASIQAIALQADGKILVGGFSQPIGQQPSVLIQRINTDGSPDPSFNPAASGSSGTVSTLTVQADGRILVGGRFFAIGGQQRANIARLNSDGTLDSFNPGAEGGGELHGNQAVVNAVALQSDGQILIGGNFETLAGQPRRYFGRLANTTAGMQSLSVNTNGTEVTWSRAGACPEVTRVTFDLSKDGVNYRSLARGKRVSTGWKRSGLKLPAHRQFFIRARGYYAGSIVESVAALNPKFSR